MSFAIKGAMRQPFLLGRWSVNASRSTVNAGTRFRCLATTPAPRSTTNSTAKNTKATDVGDYPPSLDEVGIDIDSPVAGSSSASSKMSSSLPNPSISATTPQPTPSPFLENLSLDNGSVSGTDWSKSYHGLSSQPFSKEAADILQAPLDPSDVEMKPDGIVYLPEIKYRRILNKAFGPGGWGLAPRSETNVGPKVVSREYALVCLGRLVAVARGEQEYFDPNGIATATESCKSNALMRCCKDLGIASELWDPRFIRTFKQEQCVEVFVEHIPTKRKRKLWRRKDQKFEYPYKE